VIIQLENLMTHPSVAARVRDGSLQLHGWIYDIPHAEFTIYDANRRVFAPLEGVADGQ